MIIRRFYSGRQSVLAIKLIGVPGDSSDGNFSGLRCQITAGCTNLAVRLIIPMISINLSFYTARVSLQRPRPPGPFVRSRKVSTLARDGHGLMKGGRDYLGDPYEGRFIASGTVVHKKANPFSH